jgi:hypothetical protein
MVRDRVLARQRDDVRGRALEHRDVRGRVAHRRSQRHRGGPTADDDDALARVVDVVGPLLGVDDAAAEPVEPFEVRRVALRVVVVAGAGEEEVARHVDRLVVGPALHVHRPARVLAGPARADDAVLVADLAIDACVLRRVADVVEDRRAVGDRLRVLPRPEREAERVHVGVRPDPRIAEQIPGAAHAIARLEDRVRAPRAALLQVVTGRDPGDPRPHHQHVDVFH